MGKVLIVDGPEKAGKTTLCRKLCAELGFQYRHWGPIRNHSEYGKALRADQLHDMNWVWDRSWASESVYGSYFDRKTELADDHWLGEWLYGNAANSWGMRVMLTKPRKPHDATDLPIPPAAEEAGFRVFAEYFGWYLPDPKGLWMADGVFDRVAGMWKAHTEQQVDRARPPAWVGPAYSPVVVLGERRNEPESWEMGPPGSIPYPGPFSSRYTTRLAKKLGFLAFHVAWTNVEDCPRELLAGKSIVACGKIAGAFARELQAGQGGPVDVTEIRHPAWLYRWGAAKQEVALEEGRFVRYIQEKLEQASLG